MAKFQNQIARRFIWGLMISVLWGSYAAGPAWSGTIKGMVRYSGPELSLKKHPVTIDKYICGESKEAEDLILSPEKGIRNAVVSLQLPPGMSVKPPLPRVVRVDQKKCKFIPHVVMVPVGGTVKFLNSDRLLHNVHSRSKSNKPFNRAQPRGRTISVKFTKPEIVRVDCDLHSWMSTWVAVIDHPFNAVTDAEGRFEFQNVPPGKYTLRVWQESMGTVSREITVTESGTVEVKLDMGRK